MSNAQSSASFPDLLRRWRGARRVSQLELALRADVSARHVAFLERGRSSPSRGMVLRLASALEVPLSERNGLLRSAGFAAAYRARPAGDGTLDLPAAALAWMLDRHAPYPGFALDRHWRIVRVNGPAERLLSAAGIGQGDSLLEAVKSDGPLRALIGNWPEVAAYLSARLQTEIEHAGGDPVLSAYREQFSIDASLPTPPSSAILPVIYQLGESRLAFFSTIAHFGGAQDIALDDLRIELMFPADESTASLLRDWDGLHEVVR